MTTASGPMACPVDGTTLTMSERAGIEIDYCPTCRGVWLDRGELDKIIERNATSGAPTPATHGTQVPAGQGPWGGHSYGGHGSHGYKSHKRRKSFLEELFD